MASRRKAALKTRMLVQYMLIPVAAPSKTWVYIRSLAGVAGSNPTGGMDVCLL